MTAARGAPEQVEAVLDRILWPRVSGDLPEDGYTIAVAHGGAGRFVVKGPLAPGGRFPPIGTPLRLVGRWAVDPKHGGERIFRAAAVVVPRPGTKSALRRILLEIPGVGDARVQAILDVLPEEDPAAALQALDPASLAARVSGLPLGVAAAVLRDLAGLLGRGELWVQVRSRLFDGVATPGRLDKVAERAVAAWGAGAPGLLDRDPWALADLPWVGFELADRQAILAGCRPDSPLRLARGIHHVVHQVRSGMVWGRPGLVGGSTAPLVRPLLAYAGELLTCPVSLLEGALEAEIGAGRLSEPAAGAVAAVCDWRAERGISAVLGARPRGRPVREVSREDLKRIHPELAEEQLDAVERFLATGALILTGAPGTGKTFTTKAILEHFRCPLVCAPTGRAARRLMDLTGRTASTIHRILGAGKEGGAGTFEFHAGNPLSGDLLLVDEMSMVDAPLMGHLLEAAPKDCPILLVGDHYQLPSVGPGAVLRDLIGAGFPTVELRQIRRQNPGEIVLACHAIKDGRAPDWLHGRQDADLHMLERSSEEVLPTALDLVLRRLPLWAHEQGFEPRWDIQVLSPLRTRGGASCQAVNEGVYRALAARGQIQPHPAGGKWGLGTKVIQTQNDYGLGIRNGDLGMIVGGSGKGGYLVEFPGLGLEGPVEIPTFDHSLELGWCITIHKAQGSEWPVVVLLADGSAGPFPDRRLLYTAVSRASRLLVVIGQQGTLQAWIRRAKVGERRTALEGLLKEGLAAQEVCG